MKSCIRSSLLAQMAACDGRTRPLRRANSIAAKQKALAEHIAARSEDAGRTVKDFNWVVHEIVHPKFIIGADGSVRWPDETIEEGEFEDTDKDTDGPSETVEPIDLPPPAPGCLARSKPWRPVHQRPA